MGIIFIAGVHAVGKTTACSSASVALGIPHHSASGLIKAEEANAISQSGKAVSDVEGNQHLLINGVRKACDRNNGRIILDGHFTLLKPDGEIEAIPVDVFRALCVDGIVVFHDKPSAIAERLMGRDNVASDPASIEFHQRLELDHARLVASQLNTPVEFLNAFDESGLIRLISGWAHK